MNPNCSDTLDRNIGSTRALSIDDANSLALSKRAAESEITTSKVTRSVGVDESTRWRKLPLRLERDRRRSSFISALKFSMDFRDRFRNLLIGVSTDISCSILNVSLRLVTSTRVVRILIVSNVVGDNDGGIVLTDAAVGEWLEKEKKRLGISVGSCDGSPEGRGVGIESKNSDVGCEGVGLEK